MSTKLNAEELAAKRKFNSLWDDDMERAYAAAIREVAQPIADQRDELLEALKRIERLMTSMQPMGYFTNAEWSNRLEAARAALAKCTPKE
jgi:hypothetical protein